MTAACRAFEQIQRSSEYWASRRTRFCDAFCQRVIDDVGDRLFGGDGHDVLIHKGLLQLLMREMKECRPEEADDGPYPRVLTFLSHRVIAGDVEPGTAELRDHEGKLLARVLNLGHIEEPPPWWKVREVWEWGTARAIIAPEEEAEEVERLVAVHATARWSRCCGRWAAKRR